MRQKVKFWVQLELPIPVGQRNGGVTEVNAHPHFSTERVVVVHNGIIENYVNLKAQLKEQGTFTSDTDQKLLLTPYTKSLSQVRL